MRVRAHRAGIVIAGWLAIFPPPHAGAADAPELVARGKYLVYAGDCAACHTRPGGAKFAGGVTLNTPFGKLATPNITPDSTTGIGTWTDDQFYRLFHEANGHHGENIYPGFPYPWFTRVTREDVLAIKAYLFTLPPVVAPRAANHLMFPLGFRPLLAGWNLLYFKPATFTPDPAKSARYNRGAYLVEGLGHCSDCHTPKNAAQAPIDNQAFAGGVVDGWYAPNISADVKEGIGGWSDDELKHYLKTGTSPRRGVVLGPMAQVVHESLAHLTDDDLADIVTYLKATRPQAGYRQRVSVLASDQRPGAPIYLTYCASCHQQNGLGVKGRIPALAENGAVLARGPENVVRVVLGGLRAQGSFGPMPGFGTVMDDQQIADIANYVRGAWGNKAPQSATPGLVSKLAKETRGLMAGTASCPALQDKQPNAVAVTPDMQQTLHGITPETLTQGVDTLVSELRSAAPHAAVADIVNQMTDAYCPIIGARTGLEPTERWDQLNQFSETLYTQVVEKGRD